MEIVVVIDDNMLEEPVRKHVANAVTEIVRKVSYEKIASLSSEIEEAVNIYMTKRMTDKTIKNIIDNEVRQTVANLIREMEE